MGLLQNINLAQKDFKIVFMGWVILLGLCHPSGAWAEPTPCGAPGELKIASDACLCVSTGDMIFDDQGHAKCAIHNFGSQALEARTCPIVLLDHVWADRQAPELFTHSPKETCPVHSDRSMENAESLELYLSQNPITSLGLPPHAIATDKCLPANYHAWDPAHFFKASSPFIPTQSVATEEERMSLVAEYYYDMNSIKYGERAVLTEIAQLDSVLNRPILESVSCEDPNIPQMTKWCENYRACSPVPKSRDAFAKRVIEAEAKLELTQIDLKKLERDPNKAQKEISDQISEKKNQLDLMRETNPILSEPDFRLALNLSPKEVGSAITRQLKANRAELVLKLESLREASRCLNSPHLNHCDHFQETMNLFPDGFLPPLQASGASAAIQNEVADSFMGRISCYRSARRGKALYQKIIQNGAYVVASMIAPEIGGGGLFSKASQSIKYATTLAAVEKSREYKAGISALVIGATSIGQAKNIKRSCGQEKHHLENVYGSAIIDQPICPNYITGDVAVAVRNYNDCNLQKLGLAANILLPVASVGITELSPLSPVIQSFMKQVNPQNALHLAMDFGKGVVGTGTSTLKNVLLFSTVSGVVGAFIASVQNPLTQEASKLGTTYLGWAGSAFSNYLTAAESSGNSNLRKAAISQIASEVQPNQFANLPADRAEEHWRRLSAEAYDIYQRGQIVTRNDIKDGRNSMRDQTITPMDFTNRVVTLDTNYVVRRNDLEASLLKLKGGAANLTEIEKKELSSRIAEDKKIMNQDIQDIAANLAIWTVWDFMYPEYRGNPTTSRQSLMDNPKIQDGFGTLLREKHMDLLAADVKAILQDILKKQGWTIQDQKDLMNQYLEKN